MSRNSLLETGSLSDNNGIRTQNHLVCKQTLNHLAKLAECLFTNYVVVGSDPVVVLFHFLLVLANFYLMVLSSVFSFLFTCFDLHLS